MSNDRAAQPSPYRTGYIRGETFEWLKVRYRLWRGLAILDGDMILGTEDQMEANRQRVADELDDLSLESIVVEPSLRWPEGIVPFRVSSAIPNQQRIRNAIMEIEKRTPLRFRLHSGEDDFITFRSSTAMLSEVGRRGGEQDIHVSAEGMMGHVIHEICHAVGLYHEHGRPDRDAFITIFRQNILPGYEEEFQKVTDGDVVGPYDYGSIMHYGPDAFALGPTRPTIRAPQPIGQRVRLSPGDIAAIEFLYA